MLSPPAAAALAVFALSGCSASPGAARDAGGPDVALPAIAVESVEPARGSFSGGTEVVVRGAGFSGGVELRFAGHPAAQGSIEIVDDHTLRAITPAGLPGAVTVSASRGALAGALEAGFSYQPARVVPATGSTAGGELVIIETLALPLGPSPSISIGDAPLAKVERIAPGVFAAVTAPGAEGASDLRIDGNVVAEGAFRYLPAPVVGATGAGGGALAGPLAVRVFDATTGEPIAGATVGSAAAEATTGAAGRALLSGIDGPAVVTASATGYETFRAFDVDRAELYIALRRRAPVAAALALAEEARVSGAIRLEAELPDRPSGAKLIAVVIPSADSPYATYGGRAVIDLDASPGGEYSLEVDPGIRALLCVVGYAVGSELTPVAFGALRRLVIGDGELVTGADIAVDEAASAELTVALENPPSVDGPFGVAQHTLRLLVDLGVEGVLPAVRPVAQAVVSVSAERLRFPAGETSISLDAVLPLVGALEGGLYTAVAGAHAGGATAPLSVRVVRGIEAPAGALTIGDFVGTPRAVDPGAGGVASGDTLFFELDDAASGDVTFSVQRLSDAWGERLLWAQAAGDRAEIPLPSAHLPEPGDDTLWTVLAVRHRIAGQRSPSSADLRAEHWSAYALASSWVRFPGDD